VLRADAPWLIVGEFEQLPQAAIASGVLRKAQNSKLKPHRGLSRSETFLKGSGTFLKGSDHDLSALRGVCAKRKLLAWIHGSFPSPEGGQAARSR
jgi:hypothetical protein